MARQQQQGDPPPLAVDAHARYLASFARVWEEDDEERETGAGAAAPAAAAAAGAPPALPPLEHVASEHFWLSGLYWGLTALHLLGRLDAGGLLDTSKAWRWVQRCFRRVDGGDALGTALGRRGGGYGGSPRHDVHLLSTTSAVQVAALLGRLDEVDAEAVEEYVTSLQLPDGSFAGDMWGEVDTRFCYCALLTLSLLWRGTVPAGADGPAQRQRQRRGLVERCAGHVLRCRNFDGGFGAQPGGESHAGQVFTCVGVLALARRLGWRWEEEDEEGAGGWGNGADASTAPLLPGADLLAWWLCERQTPSGGLNGRPEKLQDVCYSWWCLSALALLGRLDWIDRAALARFVLKCQDLDRGGISDRPDDAADVYHTFFGIAGLGLLGWPGVAESVDAAFALPKSVVARELGGAGGSDGALRV